MNKTAFITTDEYKNALLEGNISNKQDKLAIWKVGDTSEWIFGKLSDLKAETKTDGEPKYKKLQKGVYLSNGWNVQSKNIVFTQ